MKPLKGKFMIQKTIRIYFLDGSFHVFKNVLEYVSGIFYFFIVQKSNGSKISQAFDRKTIEIVERKNTDNTWKEVKLKKKRN